MTRPALVCAAWLLALVLCPAGANAALTIESFAASRADTQAGAHPTLSASFSFGESGGAETAESARLRTPAGLFVDPSAVPRCGADAFAAFACPPSTQVGLITIRAGHEGNPSYLLGTAPLYSLLPGDAATARLGFVAPTVDLPVEIAVTVRASSDYGLDFTLENLPASAPLDAAALRLWGVPADPSHDSQRFPAGSASAAAGCPGGEGTGCIADPTSVNILAFPLLVNPTSCDGDFASRLDVNTAEQPATILTAVASEAGTSDCDQVDFQPQLSTALTTAMTSAASGLSLDLGMVHWADPYGIDSAAARALKVTLPPGVRVDPAAVATTGVCDDAQFGLGGDAPAACPGRSKIGTFSLGIMGLEEPLDGTAYLGGPGASGSSRLLLTASGAAIDAKLVGLLQPGTGGEPATVSLSNLPQVPLEELALRIGSGPGLLVTPARCGTYTAAGRILSWSSTIPTLTSNEVALTSAGPSGGPCPDPVTAIDTRIDPDPPLPGPTLLPPPTAVPPPVVRLSGTPPRRTSDRTPTFRFGADQPGSTFSCKLDRKPARPCTSPKTLPRLSPGPHTLSIGAVNQAGARSQTAVYRFTIRPPRA